MLFSLVKFYARIALQIYCRKIILNKPELLHIKGPVLFAANHPNSFLDGIILTTLLEHNLYSLARGDAFKKPRFAKWLRWLHLLPVYRTSEGVENLSHNYTTFAACHEVFVRNGIVMIFSEGRCVNEWHLRPLKKGTARLAISAWQKDIDLIVIPVGFNYNTFRNFGKNVVINFGKPLNKEEILQHRSDGKSLLKFNQQLYNQLQQLVFEIEPTDRNLLREKLCVSQPIWKQLLLAIPAIVGWMVHAPLYFLVKGITKKYFDNDHFDSVVAAILMLLYPFYVLLFCIVGLFLFNWTFVILIIVLMPFTAWACVQLKNQLDS